MPLPPTPEFWDRPGILPSLLQPLAATYAAAGFLRRAWVRPVRVGVPVICVGNVVVGGAGKTPVVLSLLDRLRGGGLAVHALSRGYGGSFAGPLAVDRDRHRADEVGDEPLLLAAAAPCWVARDRGAGARAAVAAGAALLVLDDGLQNPCLAKDLSLLVIDGAYGSGNGHVLPAGPLREPLDAALARAQAVVLVGEDKAGIAQHFARHQVLRADLVPENGADFAGREVIAFAGIGRPAKFFASIEACGARVIARHAFPDHHRYTGAELERLAAAADSAGAALVTTAKDAVRLAPGWRKRVGVLRVAIRWQQPAALDAFLARFVHG